MFLNVWLGGAAPRLDHQPWATSEVRTLSLDSLQELDMSSSEESEEIPKPKRFPAPDLLQYRSAWLFAANFIRYSEDYLREKYRSDPWLREFVDTSTRSAFGDREATHFPSSREKFMADSSLFLHLLQSFERDLRFQEMTIFMLTGLPRINSKLGDCFIYICAELIARDEHKECSAAPESAERSATMIEPYHPPALKKAHSRHLEAANTIMSCKERLLVYQKETVDRSGKTDLSKPTHCHLSRESLRLWTPNWTAYKLTAEFCLL